MKVSSVSSMPTTFPRPTLHLMAIPLSLVLMALGMTHSQADDDPALQADGFAAMERMDPEEMGKARAKEGDTIINLNKVQSIQDMKSSVSDTSFDIGGDMVSGNISFAADALGSYSGTGIFNAVTGSGNSINNAVGISVFIAN